MSTKREKIKVYDMTCTSCEGKVERSLIKFEGVVSVKANHRAQEVIVEYDSELCQRSWIKERIKLIGYSVEKSIDYKIIGIFIVAASIILLGSSTNGFDMNAKLNGASYFILFVVGMLTSIHCVGMCGGIMLSQSISKVRTNRFHSIGPALMYNVGRIVAYTLIGGIVGAVGSVVSISLAAKATMQIFAAIFMIIMGLNMAGFRIFSKFNIKLKLPRLSVKNRTKMPFLIGMLNGLMPCGPLQTMQLYALGTGSAVKGALSMLLFGLGTVPLMLTFGALSGLLSKGYTKKILKMSGFLVIILGLIMGNRALALSGIGGIDIVQLGKKIIFKSSTQSDISKAILKDDIQELTMIVDGSGFTPNILYVKKNVPVKWIVKGDAINPCNNAIVIPSLNKQYNVKPGENVIEFTPGDKDINFSCWMGMIKGTIKVTDNLDTIDTSESISSAEDEKVPSIFGDDLTLVPTERIVKKANLEDNIQRIKIKGIGYEFEPLIIIANKDKNMKISLDLRAFDNPEEKFNIIDSNTKETVASIEGKKDIVVQDVLFEREGAFVITSERNVLTVILVVNEINTVDLEAVREEYLNTK
ncbi:urease accessory protein UreH domain-containing protein [Clostridium sp. LP20]|uniref:urease accessory protein UreH domain-containing protein n=1 Tax=Clostridium sp. LP20 TaxID=3418665 RepID=UPI003EE50B1A